MSITKREELLHLLKIISFFTISYTLFIGLNFQLNTLFEMGVISLALSFCSLIYLLVIQREFKKSGDKTGGCALGILFIAMAVLLFNGLFSLGLNYFIS